MRQTCFFLLFLGRPPSEPFFLEAAILEGDFEAPPILPSCLADSLMLSFIHNNPIGWIKSTMKQEFHKRRLS